MAEILSTIAGCLSPIIKEYVIDHLKVQFSLLCCSKSIFDSLRDQVRSLDNAKATLQLRVDADRRNLKIIAPHVENWLKRVDEIKTETDSIFRDISNVEQQCVNGSCLKLKLRYSISRKAMKMAKDIVELLGDCKSQRIAHSAPPPGVEIIPGLPDPDFESRKTTEEEIMAALRDDRVYLIGVCGKGGVGKTTMVKKIGKKAKEENLFDVVGMVVVSQQPDLKRIQQEIAEALGLKLEQETVSIRARLMHTRLMDAERILIILDDIWSRLNLEELGIPSQSNHKGCKVILTSRIRHVFTEMEATKIFSLENLLENEAWALFMAKAGTCVDDRDLHQITKDVAKECKGLPLALVTVGCALRDQNAKPVWEDALVQLQRSTPLNIPGLLKDVYLPLELSYNHFESNEARYLFLLCCLFPDDSRISLRDLLYYGVGLHIFSDIETLREARDKAYELIEMLENRYMLLDDGKYRGIKYVKMHDVIRDLAKHIASTVKHVFLLSHDTRLNDWPRKDSYKNYTCISLRLEDEVELPECIDCPKLKMLRTEFHWQGKVPDRFFSGMKELNVLDIKCIATLPSSLQLLTNLRTLRLRGSKVKTVSVIGGLVKLEILDLRNSELESLPKEIGGLENLKSLDLSECSQLREIAPGVLSSLVRLEELFMLNSFQKWEAEVEGKERGNASLEEVACLKNLTALQLEIPDPKVLPQDTLHWPKVESFAIWIGKRPFHDGGESYGDNKLILNLNQATPLVHALTRYAHHLELKLGAIGAGHEVSNSIQEGNQNLKWLSLDGCDNMTYLANRLSEENSVFPMLRYLSLSDCRDLEALCRGGVPLVGSFDGLEQLILQDLCKLTHLWDQNLCLPNLRQIFIRNCSSLQYVFLQSTAESLSRLRLLEIEECPLLEEVFKAESGGRADIVSPMVFPKLTSVILMELPIVNSFCRAVNAIDFQLLHTLHIESSYNMEVFCPMEESNFFGKGAYNSDGQYLFHQKVTFASLVELKLYNISTATKIFSSQIPIGSFSRLELLEVVSCSNLKVIFSPPATKNFGTLRKLTVKNCSKLKELVKKEDEESQTAVKEPLFPELKNLILSKLPNFKLFCHMTNDIELPLLESINIVDCPQMKTFSLGSLSLPRLTRVFGLLNPYLSAQIYSKKKFDRVGHSAPSPVVEITPVTAGAEFESRKRKEEEIMDALRNDSVYFIGICGMGGVGKTTMAERIWKRAKEEENPFDMVAKAVVSQQPDEKMIQKQIAKYLDIDLEEDDELINAEHLRSRLGQEKSFLIIIDDIWKAMNLEELGIPSQSSDERRKVIVTSRDLQVCTEMKDMLRSPVPEIEATEMEDTKIFTLKCLTEKEAWDLFRAKAGIGVEDRDLHQIAEDVAKECKGLPLSLITVAGALANKKSKPVWEDAFTQLQRCAASKIVGVDKDAYRTLVWSYNHLEDDEAKDLFLLCSLFPEDSSISLRDLLYYGIGLRIFSTVVTLKAAKNRLCALVGMLQDRNMLMDEGEWNGIKYVKMHDVIRDMAISIASSGEHVFMINHDAGLKDWPRKDSHENCTCISLTLNGDVTLPECINCPRLELLRIKFYGDEGINCPDKCFDTMRELNVLDVDNITSLPSSLQFLTNIRTLRLQKSKMKTVSMIGRLVKLEILDLNCSNLEVLPKEIGELENLNCLDLSWCQHLREIAPGVISSLTRLEELFIYESFKNWEAEVEGKERGNASLVEVASLKNLTALKIEIPDPKVLPQDALHWSMLERFAIWIGTTRSVLCDERIHDKSLIVDLNETTPLVHALIRKAHLLELKLGGMCANDEVINSIQGGNQDLKRLSLEGCGNINYLANIPNALQYLKLNDLCKLTHLSDQKLCLPHLSEVCIQNCSSLQYVFLQSTAENLSQLKILEIKKCPVLEEVFKAERGESADVVNPIVFPNLTRLWLKKLPNLISFCKAFNGIDCPLLEDLQIESLHNLKVFWPMEESSSFEEGEHNSVSSQFLFHQKVFASLVKLELSNINATKIFSSQIPVASFSQLQLLEVNSCPNLEVIFSPPSFRHFRNLKELRIHDCWNLEAVVGKEDEKAQAAVEEPLFPELKTLTLKGLPNFKKFCHMKNDIEWQKLESVTLDDCPQMEYAFGLLDPNVATQFFHNREVTFASLVKMKLYNITTATKLFSSQIPIASFNQLELLEVQSCPNLKIIFSPLASRNFKSLHSLTLKDCSNLEEVIAMEDEGLQAVVTRPLFPKLKKLELSELPNMKLFCHMKNGMELPQLKRITIEGCHKMETFSLGSLNLPHLTYIFGSLEPDVATQIFCEKEILEHEIHLEKDSFTLSAKDLSISDGHDEAGLTISDGHDEAGWTISDGHDEAGLTISDGHDEDGWTISDGHDEAGLTISDGHDEDGRTISDGHDEDGLTISDGHDEAGLTISDGHDEDGWIWCLVKYSSDNFIVVARQWEHHELKISGRFEMLKLSPETLYEVVLEIMLDEDDFFCNKPVNIKLTQSEGITKERYEDLECHPTGKWIEVFVGEFTTSPDPIGDLEFSFYSNEIGGLLVKGVTIRPKT